MYYGEKFNSISHLLGALAALPGLVYLIVIASSTGDPWKIVSSSIYGSTLLLLFIISTLYHSFQGRRLKGTFQKLDHISIYLLIAGTYTPFMLVTLRGVWGWSILAVVWGLAIVGIIIDSMPRKGRRILPVIIYLLMGWTIVVAFKPLSEQLLFPGLIVLVLGGVFYSVGLIFYAFDTHMRHGHGIWHLFVLSGGVCHYISISNYVI